ncbi:MAG: hypothetical protein HY652_01425 [Acidobacteria bacterium]|nr:hypothetical protein [Acidobacteriota bacterium]
MAETPHRLGDMVEDYCTRCRLLTNHAIVSMIGSEVGKVHCLTCLFQHDYRHGKGGRRKKSEVQTLFDQVVSRLHKPPEKPGAPKKGSRRES